MLAESADERVPPDAALDSKPGQVALTVRAADEGCGEALGERRRVEVLEGLGDGEGGHGGDGRDEPADTEPGEPELRSAALVDDDAGRVLGLQRRGRLLLEVEVPVKIALHDRHPVLEREFQHAAPPLGRQHRSRGILERRDEIDQLRPVARQCLLQRIDPHAVVVDRQTDDVSSGPPERQERAWVGGALREHHVARREEGPGEDVQPLLAPGGHEDFLGSRADAAGAEPAGKGLPEHRVAPRRRRIVEAAIAAGQGVEERVQRLDRVEARVREPVPEADEVRPTRSGVRHLHALDGDRRDALGPGEGGVTGIGRRPHDGGAPAHVSPENASGLELLVGPGHRRPADTQL